MSDEQVDKAEVEKQLILDAREKGKGAVFKTYVKLSGPGWLQGAITLGGGSLAGSLYLGVIGGYKLLWLQPLMMILGILMLSVISYVTLSTGEKPFQAINKHVNPVLGWGWLIAAMLANLVWAMPQFSLGTAAIQQNLFPGLSGGAGDWICVLMLFVIAAVVVWFYDSGSKGIKVFEWVLKGMVGIVVLSFFGVVYMMAMTGAGLPWGEIVSGLIPDPSLLFKPASTLQAVIDQTSAPEYWNDVVLGTQRDLMITAAATAVGINMTFLLPYSMLRKGWGKTHRGLASFDLSIGLFIPFFLATTCVVIAASSQFHRQWNEGLVDPQYADANTPKLQGAYDGILNKRIDYSINKSDGNLTKEQVMAELTEADKQISAMLIQRDAFQLANSLEKLTDSKTVAQYIFGIGVLGMAVSTIIILMLINGFCVTEMLGSEMRGMHHRIGSMLPGITGALGFLFLWGNAQARFYLAVPTSVFGMILLPIAYVTFFLMINSPGLLGDSIPKGNKRLALNIGMVIAILASSIGALWAIWSKLQWIGIGCLGAFIAAVLVVHFARKPASSN